MNTQVTATSMQIKAIAEDGLLIKNELDDDVASSWKVSTNASYSTLVELAPTSTADVTAWYHNKSDAPTTAKADQKANTYETLSAAHWLRDTGTGNSGAYYSDTDGGNDKDANEKSYVLLNKFFIKSSGDAIDLGAGETYTALYINKVIVSAGSTSVNLDKSLRVAIKINDNLYIYAPVDGATLSYNVGGYTLTDSTQPDTAGNRTFANSVTALSVPDGGIRNDALPTTGTTAIAQIPAITVAVGSTIEADVYIYFEGEDANCKSEYITDTLDTLNVSVIFGITSVS